MLTGLSAQAREAKSWPFEQARLLLARILRLRLTDAERDLAAALFAEGKFAEAVGTLPALARPVIFQCGYGASGLPHLGTFGEAARPTMVRTAFRALTEDAVPTQLIVFSDDMDGFRKIPDNVPNRAMLEEDRDKPLTSVRDPFGEHDSFGAHNNARLRAFLDAFGFDYEFKSSTETYRSGEFDDALLRILDRYDKVMAVMLPTLGEERQQTYSPFLPISPRSGKVLLAKVVAHDVAKGTITYVEEDGSHETVPVTGGHCKLQWKPDMGMRWAALGVDYEMYGKDHLTSAVLYDAICRIAGGTPPDQYMFELFLDEKGQKISKSKGNGITIEEWLTYGTAESLALFMFQKPRAAKRLYFDVIPKAVDDYIALLDAYHANENAAERLENPVWFIHGGEVPKETYPVSFALLLNLVSASGAHNRDVLWGFIRAYAPDASPEKNPGLERLVGYALRYYEDFVKPAKQYRAPDDKERVALGDLATRLEA